MKRKDPVAARLAAKIAGERKTGAARTALAEREERLARLLLRLLETKIWPALPPRALGRRPSRREWVAVLGYGPEGV